MAVARGRGGDDEAPEPMPAGRLERLRELERLTDDDAIELVIAHRLGYRIPGGSGAAEWDRLHSWERAILLRGTLALHELEAERLAAVLGDDLEARAVAILAAILPGVAEPAPPRRVEPSSPLEAVAAGDAAAVAGLEARASRLAGMIEEGGGTVPSEAGEDDAGAHPLGITVRKV